MSLRTRVIALLGLVLFVSLVLGTLVAGYQTKQALKAELTAALVGGERTVRTSYEDLGRSDHQERDLRQLVSTFDENRHVAAILLDADGAPAGYSATDTSGARAPRWFARLLGDPPASRELRVPKGVKGFYAIVLEPTPAIDAGSAWREFIGVVLVLGLTFAAGLTLVSLVLSAALRPLAALATGFDRIGVGDYGDRVPEGGASDLVSLQRGFNVMTGKLAAMTERNRHLNEQLLTIQDEERADIARDLHDEVGPHLFAVNMDAELIAQLIEAGRHDAALDRVRAIQGAVGHMQRQVRDLLGRLRPARATEFGLNAALRDLERFWQARRPDIRFELSLCDAEAEVSDSIREASYRIAQEAVNNAVRHARPRRVALHTELQNDRDFVVTVFDDGEGDGASETAGGFGIVGMRERAAALGGSLLYGRNPAEGGWRVVARLPLPQAQSPLRASAAP